MDTTAKLLTSLGDTQEDVDELRPYVVELDEDLSSVVEALVMKLGKHPVCSRGYIPN